MSRTALLAVAAWIALAASCLPADPPPAAAPVKAQTSGDKKERQRAKAEMQRLIRQANQLKSAGRLTDAIAAGLKAAEQARAADGALDVGDAESAAHKPGSP